MSAHFRVLCWKCKAVIAQCRCTNFCDKDDKTQSYGVCDKCRAKKQNNATEKEIRK